LMLLLGIGPMKHCEAAELTSRSALGRTSTSIHNRTIPEQRSRSHQAKTCESDGGAYEPALPTRGSHGIIGRKCFLVVVVVVGKTGVRLETLDAPSIVVVRIVEEVSFKVSDSFDASIVVAVDAPIIDVGIAEVEVDKMLKELPSCETLETLDAPSIVVVDMVEVATLLLVKELPSYEKLEALDAPIIAVVDMMEVEIVPPPEELETLDAPTLAIVLMVEVKLVLLLKALPSCDTLETLDEPSIVVVWFVVLEASSTLTCGICGIETFCKVKLLFWPTEFNAVPMIP